VTGGSSGIGKAIARSLASQGINIIVAALEDQVLSDTVAELSAEFPGCQIVPCGVNLGDSSGAYMDHISRVCQDKLVSIVVNNAGYITMGHFADVDLSSHLKNMECNSIAAMRITHLFLNKMLDRNTKGLIVFTSSSASFFPTPISSVYGSSKCFLTEFGASIAAEVYDRNIDVLVVNPSPINSRFYAKASHVSAVKFFQSTAAGPEVIADAVLRGAGRLTVWDQGYFSILVRFLLKVLDWNVLTEIITRMAQTNADHLTLRKSRPLNFYSSEALPAH